MSVGSPTAGTWFSSQWRPDNEFETDRVLQARAPDDQGRLARLVAEALPTSGAVPVSGSMQLGRVSGLPPFVVHIKPVGVPQPDYGARPVAALVLIVEPGRHPRLDSALVARTLRLTPAESQVAALLADGKTVRDIAPGDRPPGKHNPLACEAHVRQARSVAAGGPGAPGAVAGQRPEFRD